MLDAFRGAKAHDYDWLKVKYFESGGPQFTKSISRAFSFVNTWAVEMRYRAGTAKFQDAKMFLDSVEAIFIWADERM